jgi:hypothetical protein
MPQLLNLISVENLPNQLHADSFLNILHSQRIVHHHGGFVRSLVRD